MSEASSAWSESTAVSQVASAENREILRRLELDVTQRLHGLLNGEYRGLVPGHGTELGETRRYAPGDDVRRIDWNVSARLQEAHIRQTIAERELQTWLVIDRSPRLDFGTALREKRELSLAATAAIGFLTNRDGNRLGALIVGRGETLTVPAKGSRKHLMRILHMLADGERGDGGGVTDLGDALDRLGTLANRRGLVVVISDFQVKPGWEESIKVLSHRHDVLAISVLDPRELELPNVGLLTVRDPATGAVREIPTNKQSVRDAYAEKATARREELATMFRQSRIDHLELRTDTDWLGDVVAFVAGRKDRMSALAAGARP